MSLKIGLYIMKDYRHQKDKKKKKGQRERERDDVLIQRYYDVDVVDTSPSVGEPLLSGFFTCEMSTPAVAGASVVGWMRLAAGASPSAFRCKTRKLCISSCNV